MEYMLNDKYNGDRLVTQCGKIFLKDKPTKVEKMSFEVERYIGQHFIIPFKEEVVQARKDIEEKQKVIDSSEEIVKVKGVSTKPKKEKSFEPVEQEEIVLED